MNKVFNYSILRYRHSYLLGEVLNVGILFYLPNKGEFRFLYPRKLQRLGNLYGDIDLNLIKDYQHAFERKAKKLSARLKQNPIIEINLESIIHRNFLRENAGSLYFSEQKKAVEDPGEETVDAIYRSYFDCYEISDGAERKDEGYIIDKVKKACRDYSIVNKLTPDIVIGEEGKLQTKFPYGWKNGTLNLIAPVSFDVKEARTIEEKTFRWHGKLDILSDDIQRAKARVDLIITKPQERSLFNKYDEALKFLVRDGVSQVIEEEKIEAYVKDAARYLDSDI